MGDVESKVFVPLHPSGSKLLHTSGFMQKTIQKLVDMSSFLYPLKFFTPSAVKSLYCRCIQWSLTDWCCQVSLVVSYHLNDQKQKPLRDRCSECGFPRIWRREEQKSSLWEVFFLFFFYSFCFQPQAGKSGWRDVLREDVGSICWILKQTEEQQHSRGGLLTANRLHHLHVTPLFYIPKSSAIKRKQNSMIR